MINRFSISILILLSALCGMAGAQVSNSVRGEVLVRIRDGYTPADVEQAYLASEGLLAQLHVKECVSDYMHIWLFAFNEDAINKQELIRSLNVMHEIEVVQVNHILENRVVPDDPFFDQQWHHVQAEDHDIDTDLAWEITTGGLTSQSDEIVVCVVELGGAKWSAPDIIENHWTNANEIPGNGIDDDLNSFIDDFDGWSTSTSTDDLSEGNHGTNVCSMIGAKGNNATGIVGVNWDVKLMVVEIAGATEASAISGYTYPLKMRKLYNQTNGAKGAFIVATNSSWGTDGQPSEAPLWCAMYDSLGVYGVLSCGATTNSNANVDITGDLPTACPSEFLLSVGRTNSQDLRASGGYGLTTIDLMAPGDNVYLANNSSYGVTTGTSFASPCVAGAIALLYSAPCSSIMQIVNVNPSEGALMIRDYIMDGVDQTTQLVTQTVSGGRLNVNNSLNLLLDECSNNGCLVPVGLSETQQGLTLNYVLSWNNFENVDAYNVHYRIVGSDSWTVVENIPGNNYLIENLLACTAYEFQVMSLCGDVSGNWTESFIWTTDGCCQNPDFINLISISATEAEIEWNEVMAAEAYNITLHPAFGEMVFYENIFANSFAMSNLDSCMAYTVLVTSVCGASVDDVVEFPMHTSGCDECSDLSYCTISASSQFEHIALVQVGDLLRSSESDGGYILVEDVTDTLIAGVQYSIALTPGFAGNSYNENFIAWIDYNSDGDFDDFNEMIYDAPTPTSETIYGNFIIPSSVQDGIVRMRIAMRYTTGTTPVEPTYCGSWTYGEIEDYCVMLAHTVGISELKEGDISFYPNPTSGELRMEMKGIRRSKPINIAIIAMDGSTVFQRNNFNERTIDLTSLPSGLYSVIVRVEDDYLVKKIVRQ